MRVSLVGWQPAAVVQYLTVNYPPAGSCHCCHLIQQQNRWGYCQNYPPLPPLAS